MRIRSRVRARALVVHSQRKKENTKRAGRRSKGVSKKKTKKRGKSG